MNHTGRSVLLTIGLVLSFATLPAFAQEMLPRPDAPFKGQIGRTAKDSTPDFPKEIVPPEDAPNILLILTDDVGFGASSPFGGPIPTPAFDRIAKEGLRFNNFHTTALCSPTRAALITGRPATTRSCRRKTALWHKSFGNTPTAAPGTARITTFRTG